jgi:hypothetical protein
MLVNGGDCSLIVKTFYREMDIPYSSETLREAVSMLYEEPAIEGNGISRAIQARGGVTGCVVTPLTIGTAPLLLYLAMGSAGVPLFVSSTRNIYQTKLNLCPMEDTQRFDLIQDRNGERKLYEGCWVKSFELRILRGETLKLKLDFAGVYPPAVYPYTDVFKREQGERFSGDCVTYTINGKEYTNIYGLTLLSKKEGGTKTELWIRRALENPLPCGFSRKSFYDVKTSAKAAVTPPSRGEPSPPCGSVGVPVAGADIPGIIDELVISAQLLRDTYEARRFGMFRITVKRLVLVSDETEVDCAGAVIAPLRYYAAGTITTEVFTSGDEVLA